jgi:hypothetical protein
MVYYDKLGKKMEVAFPFFMSTHIDHITNATSSWGLVCYFSLLYTTAWNDMGLFLLEKL